MIKTRRCLALLLILTFLCGMIPAAGADAVTLGIYFCGRRTAEDGSEMIVKLDGQFRVTQNGIQVGYIEAGKTLLNLSSTDSIRITPMAESISPEWDLSTASCEISPEGGGTITVPIVVELQKGSKAKATAKPKATSKPKTTAKSKTTAAPKKTDTNTEKNSSSDQEETTTTTSRNSVEKTPRKASGPSVTPTLPPYDLSSLEPTPEPQWKKLSSGSGSVKVYAFHDQSNNGLPGSAESAVSGVTVCLFTEKNEAVKAVKTDSSGYAQFKNLPAGKYRIKAILPRGWMFGKKGDKNEHAYAGVFDSSIDGEAMSGTFNVRSDETATQGIALSKTYHVSGTCWFETTLDGVFGDGEKVLPGVKIELNGERNGLHYETVSAADGTFYIDRVMPALYKMTVHAPSGMMFTRTPTKSGKRSVITKEGSGKASVTMDLNDKESKDKQYIGFTWAGSVSGICFLDANYNGIYDDGDLPMPGVKVTAIKQNKDEEIAVTYSGEDGRYKLTGLRANTYTMRAVLPDDGSDFTKTVSNLLGNHFASRPGRRENFWKNYELGAAEQAEMNVGVIYPGAITGTVYMDDDFSGSQNGKEKTVSGYLVTLVDKKGNTIASDKTSVKGKYELTKIPPGKYSLQVTALKGYAFTKQGKGNVILNKTNGEGYSETFQLSLKEKKTGMDIGMIKPGTVQGTVFADKNDNGVQDSSEKGLSGVVVRLMSDEGEAFKTTVGKDGEYLFDAVMPGTYWLEYTLPDNAVFARTKKRGNTITGDGTGRSESFRMKSGTVKEGPVCGALTLGKIEGTAYLDHDGDGTNSDSEETAEGLTLTLTPSRKELEPVTVTTGANGKFVLENLRPDEYTLAVDCPDAHVLSRTDNLSLPLTPGKNSQSVKLTVSMGATWKSQKLGVVIPASLSGQVWLDENDNGLFDAGEQTPSGYEITVTDNRNGKTFDKLVTDKEGRFHTSGMIPGSFSLSYELDKKTIAPKKGNSNFREEKGKLVLSGIQLSESESREGILLGVVRYTTISGSVWTDRGGDIKSQSGVKITLKDGEGNTVKSVTTAADGKYKFDKLMPGTYVLNATMPEGCVIIEPGDSRLDGKNISVMTTTLNRKGSSDPIDLKMGHDRTQMNIGGVLPGRLGDFCWLDLDGDGLQGMDEPGIPGVKIALMRNGKVVAETVSDQYGFYRFTDLYPAEYTMLVTSPAEVKPTKHRTDIPMIASVLEETDGETCETVPVNVESDKANYNADLGFVCRRSGVLPAGVGEGKKQNWKGVN